MYQTVGHDAIDFVAQCMDLPLIRRPISGSAINQTNRYRHRIVDDEVEDLYALLCDVLERFPDIEAVSVGAILSNYQRVRVEHVCGRLGLKCVAYLWQRDQKELLQEMFECGMDVMLIKIAGMGLTTRKHLGTSLQSIYGDLCRLSDQFGVHVAGEGGEYESLTLDCPLYKKRLVVSDTSVIVHSDDAFAQVAYLALNSIELEEKKGTVEERLEAVRQVLLDSPTDSKAPIRKNDLSVPCELEFGFIGKSALLINGDQFTLNNVCLETLGLELTSYSLTEEVELVLERISTILQKHRLTFENISMVNLLVRDMSDFASINTVYRRFFGSNHPACRACIQVPFPDSLSHCNILISIEGTFNASSREILHVQSISKWAPANIGPYSQSVFDPCLERYYLAGQIGLVPETMQVASKPELEWELVMRHVLRVSRVMLRRDDLEMDEFLSAYLAKSIVYVSSHSAFDFAKEQVAQLKFGKCKSNLVLVSALPRGVNFEWVVELGNSSRMPRFVSSSVVSQDTLDIIIPCAMHMVDTR